MQTASMKGMMSIPDCSGVLPRVYVSVVPLNATRARINTTYSLVEQRKLVGTAEHTHHQKGHGTHRAELSPVAKERQGDERMLVEVVLPSEEDADEDTAENEEQDDAPVYLLVGSSACSLFLGSALNAGRRPDSLPQG